MKVACCHRAVMCGMFEWLFVSLGKCLFLAGITETQLNHMHDETLPEKYSIGFTNMVQRTTPGSKDLSRFVCACVHKRMFKLYGVLRYYSSCPGPCSQLVQYAVYYVVCSIVCVYVAYVLCAVCNVVCSLCCVCNVVSGLRCVCNVVCGLCCVCNIVCGLCCVMSYADYAVYEMTPSAASLWHCGSDVTTEPNSQIHREALLPAVPHCG